jgi:hypothetical protein
MFNVVLVGMVAIASHSLLSSFSLAVSKSIVVASSDDYSDVALISAVAGGADERL